MYVSPNEKISGVRDRDTIIPHHLSPEQLKPTRRPVPPSDEKVKRELRKSTDAPVARATRRKVTHGRIVVICVRSCDEHARMRKRHTPICA